MRALVFINNRQTKQSLPKGHNIVEFLHDTVLPFLRYKDADVRNTAAQVISGVLGRDIILQQRSQHSLRIVENMITALLKTAVCDPGKSVD